ncbi:MAG: hypothetical protein IT555_20405 [Acetobacteraceae bacterium]|nr:hypothetical protein [Acetobacteraceae bacterium]
MGGGEGLAMQGAARRRGGKGRELAGAPEIEEMFEAGDELGDAAVDEDDQEGGEDAIGQRPRKGARGGRPRGGGVRDCVG